MSRDPDPTIKPALLEKILVYLLSHGLADLSLRPLAEAVGTTARMLIYHFRSKEQLIVEALGLAQGKQIEALRSSPTPKSSTEAELTYLWQWFTSDEFLPFVKLLFEVEVQAMSGNELYSNFANQILDGWVNFVKSRLANCDTITATLIVNTFSGLLLDRLITNDVERVDASFKAFASLVSKS